MTVILILSKNAYLDYFCLFILGISVTMRYYVGYTYNVELQPKTHQVIVGTIQFIGSEALVFLFICYYFAAISKYWIPLQIPNIVLTCLGIVFVFNMPESPRFLIAQHQYEKARAVFNIMGKWNKKGLNVANSFVFPEEAKRDLDHQDLAVKPP